MIYDKEIQDAIDADKAKALYEDMCRIIKEAGFESYIDQCVDRENCVRDDGTFLTEKDGEAFWCSMRSCMILSVGSRLEEIGISAYDYGIPY